MVDHRKVELAIIAGCAAGDAGFGRGCCADLFQVATPQFLAACLAAGFALFIGVEGFAEMDANGRRRRPVQGVPVQLAHFPDHEGFAGAGGFAQVAALRAAR